MKKLLLLSALAIGPAASFGFVETEANDTWLTPNLHTLNTAGDFIDGVSTGTSTTVAGIGSADHFQLSTGVQAMNVYINRLEIAAPGHVGALLGRTTAVTALTSTAIQSSSTLTTPARMNQWYSFGAVTSVDYKVTGAATTTAGYRAVYSQSVATVVNLGTVTAGLHNFATLAASTSDTEIFLLDMSGNILEQNDDTTSATTDSEIDYNLVAGQSYYVAVGRFNTAGNQAMAGVGVVEPGDFAGSYFQHAGMLASGSNTAGNYILAIDGVANGTAVAFAANTDPYRVDFYKVQAVPEPGTMAALGLGVAALARRRRNKK